MSVSLTPYPVVGRTIDEIKSDAWYPGGTHSKRRLHTRLPKTTKWKQAQEATCEVREFGMTSSEASARGINLEAKKRGGDLDFSSDSYKDKHNWTADTSLEQSELLTLQKLLEANKAKAKAGDVSLFSYRSDITRQVELYQMRRTALTPLLQSDPPSFGPFEMARDAADEEEEEPIVWEDPPVYRPPPPPKTQAEKDLQAQLDRLKAMKTGVQGTINSMPREWWKFQRPDGVIFW